MSLFSIYREEILNFLRTTTIKFEKLGKLRNNELQYTYTIDPDDKTQWPYYLNMVGEYHASDTVMYIKSLDTGETVPFTKETLNTHPKTAKQYKPGKDKYSVLESIYPTQRNLIKSIVYPVSDINVAIDAEEFTLLAYDDSYLESTERYDIVQFIHNFLYRNCTRWYIQELEYEELYPIAFYSILYYVLSLNIFARRLENIHTGRVHSFHVWQYLTSKGLGDYRDILSTKQALFLYRNINYLYKNKGKQSNLIVLADNLLKELRVSIVGKTIFHNNAGADETCLWTPEILSDPIVDYDSNAPDIDTTTYSTINTINTRMYEAGFEPDNSADHIKEVTETLSYTTRNILETKLLEIKKYIIDNKYENILIRFILDNLIRRMIVNKLNFTISLTCEDAGVTIDELSIQDTLLLLHYCASRYRQEYPVNLPTCYVANTSYHTFVKPTDIPITFSYFNDIYKLTNHIDVEQMVNEIPYINYTMNQNEFMDHLADQFIILVKHIRYIRSSSNKLVHLSVGHLYKTLMPIDTMEFTLTSYSNYAEWIASKPGIKSIIAYFDSTPEPTTLYGDFGTVIMEQLLPLTNTKFSPYITANDSNNSYLYKRLKELFVQLCSYNIAFLDTQRDSASYIFLSNLPVDPCGYDESTEELYIDPLYDNIGLDVDNIEPINIETEMTSATYDSDESTDTIEVDPLFDISTTMNDTETVNMYNETLDATFTEIGTTSVIRYDITCGVGFFELD